MPLRKIAASLIERAAAARYVCSYRACRMLLGRERAFKASVQRLSRLAGNLAPLIRRRALRQMGCDVAADCHIEIYTLLSRPQLAIGSGVYIGANCSIGWAIIGDNTKIADGVRIPSGARQHIEMADANAGESGKADIADQKSDDPKFCPVRIGKNCWIGANAVVMADVGDNCIIGAGSVVTRPVESGSVAVGAPARVIRKNKCDLSQGDAK